LQAAIMYNLKLRHIDEQPYTRTGDILIAVNPYKWHKNLYTEKKRVYYSNRLVWENHEGDPRAAMQPHVYEVSALSYRGLIEGDVNQSILVSGESGAGKTETVKICMNHIASVQKGPTGQGKEPAGGNDPTVERVVQSNPLMEAFGNAKTRRNDNSSRFGKYLQLQFDKSGRNDLGTIASRCALVGSKCDVYLLEKNRVISHDAEERTFHIFYQLLASSDAVKTQFWHRLEGTTTQSFSYIGHSNTNAIEGVTDANRFFETLNALKIVGVEGQKLEMLMRAICIVMQCGNLGFDSLNDDCDKSMVCTKDELSALADLMGVCEKDLTLSFTERTFVTAKETHKVPLNAEMAKDACDALAKEVYQKVFLWIASSINEATSVDESSEKEIGTIGLLDIFGFEIFELNRFEQLCINYANEKLQQKFTEDIFINVQAEYKEEGIELADIWYDDNKDVLDLIERPTGLLALLNEECVRPKGNDMEFVQKILAINKNSPCLFVNRIDRVSFGIMHYAGKGLRVRKIHYHSF
jgi:myosin-5